MSEKERETIFTYITHSYHPVVHDHEFKESHESGAIPIEVVAIVILIGIISAN